MTPEAINRISSAPLKTETLLTPELVKHNDIVVVTGVTCSGKDFLLGQVMKEDSL